MQCKHLQRRIFLFMVALTLGVSAAGCGIGGFQLRSQPTATPAVKVAAQPSRSPSPTGAPTASPTLATQQSPTPTAAPTAAAGLWPGKPGRATTTVNVRDNPGTAGKQVGKLNAGQVVTLRAGPVEADNYVWWQIDNGAGLTGWVAAGPTDSPWLVPEGAAAAAPATPGGERLVERAIRTGDRVQVTTDGGKLLTVREAAGKDARNMANVVAGTRFNVRSGPERRDGLTWWELEGDQVKGWAAEGDGKERWLTPIER